MEYFEVCISPGSFDSIFAHWICIKGVREPSLMESEAFLKSFDDLEENEHVIDVVPIDEVDAMDDYNFDDEKEWPVFGLIAVQRAIEPPVDGYETKHNG